MKKYRVVSSFDVGREIYTDEYVKQLEEELEEWKRPILCHWCKEGVTDAEAYEHYKSCGKNPLAASLASARAIMQKFVDKVDRGMARSTDGWIVVHNDMETYAEMKEWLDE